uniref:Reverse transcriptase Ty1/copia-type domain-containing protein n=1 Tax=Fagus sylvatica TaxID=28930 RepID=A0A2N9G9K8_FAGSY
MAEELTLEQIGTHLRIEEESRIREGTNSVSKVNEGTVNYVLNGGVGSSKTNKSFRPNKKIVKKTNSNKDKKEKELNTSEANVVDEIMAMVSEMQIGMITEVHMANAAENSSEWWYDSGATIHVCNNKMLFKKYVEAGNGLEVLMGNHNTTKVFRAGTVELILSSGKKLKLTNVYHVPNIKKNLVSASLLSKNGVKAVLESDKLILSKFEGNREKVLSKLPFVGNVEEDPNTFSEAMVSRDAAFWKEAVNDEINSILSNNTWVLVDLPPGFNTIGCKWVFRRKYRTDRTIQTFKARLVAKGFRQREGIDYFDTYAPVARITSIRVLIALASIYKLVKVCKLVKSLYGLKQAPKQWHEKFDTVILANGFKHNGADKCVYSKFTSEYGVIVCLYVDDMLIFGTNMLGVCETKKYLASVFKMKDLNEADTILVENTGRAIAQLEFASAIGSMMYAMHCTRLDIAFAVNRLSRYTSNPNVEHWKAIARVLGYLKKTKDLGLYYSGYPAVLEGYSNANWVTNVGDNKSTFGWIFTLGGGAISWSSKKQSCISHSTMESEFIALALAGKEAEWLRNMLYDIELWPQPMLAISIYCDSQATMSKAYSKIYNGKSRHISLRHEDIKKELHLCEHRSGAASKQELRLIQSPGLVVQSTGCRAWEFLPDSVAWTTNSSDWITAIRGS